MEAAIQIIKLKVDKFQLSNKSIQGTYHPLTRGGRKKKNGEGMKAAIQNIKLKVDKFQSSKQVFKVDTVH